MANMVIEIRWAGRGIMMAGAFAVACALAACSSGSPEAATTVTQTVIRETVTVSPSSATTPATAEAETPEPAVATPAEVASTPETFAMPKLVGVNLQLAQDTLQSLGSYVLDQEDASGLERFQVNDSNWKVCSQKPKAGASVRIEAVVLLSSVKLAEDCP
jgi:hypothetical protein